MRSKRQQMAVRGASSMVVAILAALASLVAVPRPADAKPADTTDCSLEHSVRVRKHRVGVVAVCGQVVNASRRPVRVATHRCWNDAARNAEDGSDELPDNCPSRYVWLAPGQVRDGVLDADAFMAERECTTTYRILPLGTKKVEDRRGRGNRWISVHDGFPVVVTAVACPKAVGRALGEVTSAIVAGGSVPAAPPKPPAAPPKPPAAPRRPPPAAPHGSNCVSGSFTLASPSGPSTVLMHQRTCLETVAGGGQQATLVITRAANDGTERSLAASYRVELRACGTDAVIQSVPSAAGTASSRSQPSTINASTPSSLRAVYARSTVASAALTTGGGTLVGRGLDHSTRNGCPR